MARPSKFTQELCERLIDAIANGQPPAIASALVGITERTLYNWLELGEADEQNEGPYFQFFQSYKKALATYQEKLRAQIELAAMLPDKWQASAWLLERRFPEQWAKKAQPEEKPKEDKAEELVKLPSKESTTYTWPAGNA